MAEVVHEEESITHSLKLGADGDVVKLILGPNGVFQCLQKDLPVDNDLASQLYGLNLLADPLFRKIRALNNNGEHQEAFVHWHTYALKYYTGESLNDLCRCLRRMGENAKPILIEVAKKIEQAIRRVKSFEGGSYPKPRHLNLLISPGPRSPDPRFPGPCFPGPRTPSLSSPSPISPGSPGYNPFNLPTNKPPGDEKTKNFRRMCSKKSQEFEDESLVFLPIVEQVDRHFKSLIDAVQGHVFNCEDFFALRHHCQQYLGKLLSGPIPSDLPRLPETKHELLYGILKYWNALSYGLLEAIAEHLQVRKLNKRLDEYKQIVAQSVATTLGDCKWKEVKMFKSQYLKVTYSEDPNKFELSRILEFQKFLEKRCGINRSLFVGAEKSSVILFFLIPHEDADRLHSEVDYSVLRSLEVCCIEFGEKWQRTIITPTEESKCQDKVYECVREAILSLAEERWEDDQLKYCYDESEWKSFKESLVITCTSLNHVEDSLSLHGVKTLNCQLKMKKTQSISISRLYAIGIAIEKKSGTGNSFGMVAGVGVRSGIGAGIGATVGTVVVPCVGTSVGAVAGAGIGLFAGSVPQIVGGSEMVQMAGRLFGRSPEDLKPLNVTAEDVFRNKLNDFRKDGKYVYACIEIIPTV